MIIPGCDISSVQARPDLTGAGLLFVYVKCKQGNDGKDPDCEANLAMCDRVGLVKGRYHFLYPLPHIDPLSQADGFQAAAGGPPPIGDMPDALDLEWPAPVDWAKWGCTGPQICGYAAAVLARMDANQGRKTPCYTYPDFVNQLVNSGGDISFLRDRPIWMAGGSKYGTGVWPTDSDPPPVIHGLVPTLVQWDGNGGRKLPDGRDCDFDVFLGDDAAFDAFRGMTH